jgi:hypothetical protein
MVPQMMQGSSEAQQLFDKYLVVGVAHAHTSAAGVTSFDTLSVKDRHGKSLSHLTGDELSPTFTGALAAMEAALSRTLGQLGHGIRWFVFDSGAVHSCGEGGMSIPVFGEVYPYKTPIAGCSHLTGPAEPL